MCLFVCFGLRLQRHQQKATAKPQRHHSTLRRRRRLSSNDAVSLNSSRKATFSYVELPTTQAPSSVKSSAPNTCVDGRLIISTSMTPKSPLKRYVTSTFRQLLISHRSLTQCHKMAGEFMKPRLLLPLFFRNTN